MLVSGKTISHYEISEELGRGGMGTVYKARDTKLDRFVALKFLPPHLSQDQESKKRFTHEAIAASALNHPNIAQIYEIDEADGKIFIVMEYIEGRSLQEIIAESSLTSSLKLCQVLDYAIQIAEGLVRAHMKGIVHRDIKPANILVTEDGMVKIVDFGLAKLAGRTILTKEGTTMGTVAYMSPEQTQGAAVDHRTDVWSLGVVLYEMLAGYPPFRGDYEQAVIYSILSEEPPSIAAQRSEVSPLLAGTVEKALQKEVDKRFDEIAHFLNELKRTRSELSTMSVEPSETIPSIAVLPFANMSADPENEYFSEGLAEELINALTKLQGLNVVARTSSFRFRGKDVDVRDVGKQLNVSSLLEGSVRKAGNQLRITAQLINVADGYHLWSERYDRELKDIFAIQDEISQAIVDTLEVKLLGRERRRLFRHYTENLEAHQLYLKGRYYFNKYSPDGPAKAIEYFKLALQHDPEYTPAYCGLADVYGQLAYWGFARPKDVLPKNKEYGLKAVELDNLSDEAHTVLGANYAYTEWDWKNAEEHFQRAIELNPNNPEAHTRYALYLTSLGRFDEASRECERGILIDPLSPVTQCGLILNHFACRNYPEAIERAEQSLEIEPNFPIHHWMLWRANALMGKYDKAIEACKKTFALWGHNEVVTAIIRVSKKSDYSSIMCQAAEAMIARSHSEYVSAHDISLFFAHAGEQEKAISWLEKSYEEQEPRLHMLNVVPDFAALNKVPGFQELLEKLGF